MKKWLEKLYETHLKFPNDIVCNKARRIGLNDQNELLDYSQWKYNSENDFRRNLAIGEGGILYPPNALNNQVTDYELALRLTPNADDLWFKAMALLNNTNVRLADNPSKVFIPIPGTQKFL
jgi:hypothetical protein